MLEEKKTPERAERREILDDYFVSPKYDAATDEYTVRDFLDILTRYRWLVGLTALAAIVAAVALAFLMTPVYRAEVVLAPVEEDIGRPASFLSLATEFQGLASLAGMGPDGGDKDKALATLKSREFTQEMIQEEGLMPILFEELWDAQSGTWVVEAEEDIPTLSDAYDLFNSEIRHVTDDVGTGMVTLTIDWKDRVLAAHWANDMVQRLNEKMRRRAISEANKSLTYLYEQLEGTSIVEIQQAIYRLIENQINKIMFANVREEYSFTVIDPAVPADEDKYIRPNRKMIIIGGFIGGMIAGVFLALFLNLIRSGSRRTQS